MGRLGGVKVREGCPRLPRLAHPYHYDVADIVPVGRSRKVLRGTEKRRGIVGRQNPGDGDAARSPRASVPPSAQPPAGGVPSYPSVPAKRAVMPSMPRISRRTPAPFPGSVPVPFHGRERSSRRRLGMRVCGKRATGRARGPARIAPTSRSLALEARPSGSPRRALLPGGFGGGVKHRPVGGSDGRSGALEDRISRFGVSETRPIFPARRWTRTGWGDFAQEIEAGEDVPGVLKRRWIGDRRSGRSLRDRRRSRRRRSVIDAAGKRTRAS